MPLMFNENIPALDRSGSGLYVDVEVEREASRERYTSEGCGDVDLTSGGRIR